tara:strand:- start:1458 stop:2552 length:1095 start_codon:yes stop_codon:yes gene_type:complete
MQWSLEDIYKKQVRGNIPPRRHLRVLGEEVDLYTKQNDEYSYVGQVSDENFDKISRIATGGDALASITKYLEGKKYTRNSFKNEYDYDSLVDMLDRGEFEKYISSEEKPSLSINETGNVVQLVTSKGFNEKTAMRTSAFTPIDEGGSNVGPCEILLALAFSNVTNSTEGGDLMIDGEKLEVKGQGGRFGQQGGRGGPALSPSTLLKGLEADNVKVVESVESNIIGAYRAFEQIGKIDLFLSNLHDLLKIAYPGGDVAKFFTNDINYIDPTSRKRGAPQSQIRKQLAKLNLQQYSTKYDLQNIIFAKGPQQKKPTPGRLGDFASFTVNDAIKEGGLIDRGILRANSFTMAGLYPNFFYMFSNESK